MWPSFTSIHQDYSKFFLMFYSNIFGHTVRVINIQIVIMVKYSYKPLKCTIVSAVIWINHLIVFLLPLHSYLCTAVRHSSIPGAPYTLSQCCHVSVYQYATFHNYCLQISDKNIMAVWHGFDHGYPRARINSAQHFSLWSQVVSPVRILLSSIFTQLRERHPSCSDTRRLSESGVNYYL